ncbi:osteoclast stimulatory transmembrane protein [Oncorhynchus kisutch]|uniref:Osteoclast stimulatory transmembrane protein n=1 Tax=Oncorhynchus kisutch TaxID=8019 RepID=A0A8C7MUY8_ONCKI|nr:osteoclast stimulatory transmembrane protein [Oncorhynchus kisutch]
MVYTMCILYIQLIKLEFTQSLVFRQEPWGAMKTTLQYLWDVYSKPTQAAKEVLTLLSMCFIIAMVTGGLLYHWMTEILRYDSGTSSTAACIYSVAILFLSFLCHPLRCVLTMILPTLGTKQGRKLIISTSVIVLVLSIILNITVNMGVVMHVLKCTSEGFVRSLLNSSELFQEAKRDLVREAIKVKQEELNIVNRLRKFDHFTHIDVSKVQNMFVTVSKQIESDFSRANKLLEDYKLLSNRILAAIFLIYLIVESAYYLKSYVISVKFDNVYITRQLLQKASKDGIQIEPTNLKNMVNSTSCKITKQEFTKCLAPIVVVTLYFIVIIFIMVLDHIVYHLVTVSGPWLLDVPATSVSIAVKYKIHLRFPGLCLIPAICRDTELANLHKQYDWTFSPEALRCYIEPSAPDLRVRVFLGLLCLVSYIMVLLEVYARRIRRKVSASFFKTQEEKRINFLLKKIQAKQDKRENNIFFIEAVNETRFHTNQNVI